METTNFNIGLEIHCDEFLYKQTVNVWNRSIIPAIQTVANEFEKLGIGQMNQDIYLSMMDSGIIKIKEIYTESIQAQIKKSKTEFLSSMALARIPELMQPLDLAIKALQLALKQPHSFGLGVLYHLFFEPQDIQIIEGKPELQMEQVRNRYCTYIETDTESEGYQLMMAVKEATDQFAEFLKAKNYPVGHRSVYDPDGFFSEVQGELKLNFDQLKTIYRYEQRPEKANN